eukprot:scaffold10657_cov194-Isochrysis_galbana.AAC.2
MPKAPVPPASSGVSTAPPSPADPAPRACPLQPAPASRSTRSAPVSRSTPPAPAAPSESGGGCGNHDVPIPSKPTGELAPPHTGGEAAPPVELPPLAEVGAVASPSKELPSSPRDSTAASGTACSMGSEPRASRRPSVASPAPPPRPPLSGHVQRPHSRRCPARECWCKWHSRARERPKDLNSPNSNPAPRQRNGASAACAARFQPRATRTPRRLRASAGPASR